jgi:hypothetical protein
MLSKFWAIRNRQVIGSSPIVGSMLSIIYRIHPKLMVAKWWPKIQRTLFPSSEIRSRLQWSAK